MGKKITPVSKTSVENTNVIVENNAPVEEVVVEKPRKKRTKKTTIIEATPLVDTTTASTVVPEVVETTTTATPDANEDVVEEITSNDEVVEGSVVVNEEEKKKKRRLVSKETFIKSAEEIQKELLPLLEESNNKKLLKAFKVFLNDAFRLLRIKTHQKKQKDASNSGFMRPVKPSSTLEKFLSNIGEDNTKPLTRAHLTTVICKYIKDNDLQNPKDRRIIFPNDEFKKLFHITENETEPLTYYNIQKRIQSHISRIEEVPVTV